MNLKIITAAVTLAALQGCASDNWTRSDTYAELAWQGLNVVDYYQTKDIQNHPDIQETNPLSRALVGGNPSSSDTAQLMATYALSHYLISRALPPKWRRHWHGSMLLGKGLTVRENHKLGLARSHPAPVVLQPIK